MQASLWQISQHISSSYVCDADTSHWLRKAQELSFKAEGYREWNIFSSGGVEI
jgi:hypothetical protein